MRFDQIDILVEFARWIGAAIAAGGLIGAVITWASLPRHDPFLWGIWFSTILSGIGLIIFATGVLAQIVTARAAQDALTELKRIRVATETAAARGA